MAGSYFRSRRWIRYARDRYITRRDRLVEMTSDGSVNDKSMYDLLIKQNRNCGICGQFMETKFDRNRDHIIPLIKGGRHVISNMQWVHRRCNSEKGSYAPWWVNWNYYCDRLNKIQNRTNQQAGLAKVQLAKFIDQKYHAAIKTLDDRINEFNQPHGR